MTDLILVTGFGPYGPHTVNPSEALAQAVDGRRVGRFDVKGLVLPVHRTEAAALVARQLDETEPSAVLHLGLAEGRARIALERAAVNVMDYPLPDVAGEQPVDEPCAAGGPAAYFVTLPLRAILEALKAEGIPAYLSNTAGTYLCNQTLYLTLHALARRGLPARAGLIHVPLLPAMVAESGLDQPSMDLPLMLRAVEVALRVVATPA